EGTAPLTRIGHGGLGSEPGSFLGDGNAVWFESSDDTDRRFWRSEGTAATTVRTEVFGTPVLAHGLAFYLGGDGGLRRSDGTPSGTLLLAPLDTGYAVGLAPFGTGVAAVLQTPGTGLYSLWESDGTPAGTHKRFDLPFSPELQVVVYALAPELFFVTRNSSNFVTTLWRSDGTAAGTHQIPSQGLDAFAPQLRRLGSRVFFVGSSTNGSRIWKIEGALGPSQLLLPLDSTAGRFPFDLT